MIGWILGIASVVAYFALAGLCLYWLVTPGRS